jgi:hypothetical protein
VRIILSSATTRPTVAVTTMTPANPTSQVATARTRPSVPNCRALWATYVGITMLDPPV